MRLTVNLERWFVIECVGVNGEGEALVNITGRWWSLWALFGLKTLINVAARLRLPLHVELVC